MELFRLLALLAAFPLSVILVLGPLLFEVVLGQPWREAGVYAQILVPWFAVIALGSPLFSMFTAKNRLGEGLAYNVVLLVTRLAALLAGGWFFGARIGLACFSGVSVIVWAYLVGRILKLAEVGRWQAACTLARCYAEAIPLLLPAGVLYWAMNMKAGALIALGGAAVVYVAVVYRRYPKVGETLKGIFARTAPGPRAEQSTGGGFKDIP